MAVSVVAFLRIPKGRFAPIVPWGSFGLILVLVFILLPKIDLKLQASETLKGPQFMGVRGRLATDGTLLALTAAFGWSMLVIFAGTCSRAHRVGTGRELASNARPTAHSPQHGLRNPGTRAPSSQMGGDLLDVVDDCGARDSGWCLHGNGEKQRADGVAPVRAIREAG